VNRDTVRALPGGTRFWAEPGTHFACSSSRGPDAGPLDRQDLSAPREFFALYELGRQSARRSEFTELLGRPRPATASGFLWQRRHVNICPRRPQAAEASADLTTWAFGGLQKCALRRGPEQGPGDLGKHVRLMRPKAVRPRFSTWMGDGPTTWWRMGDRSYSWPMFGQLAPGYGGAPHRLARKKDPFPKTINAAYSRLKEKGPGTLASGETEPQRRTLSSTSSSPKPSTTSDGRLGGQGGTRWGAGPLPPRSLRGRGGLEAPPSTVGGHCAGSRPPRRSWGTLLAAN